MDVGLRVMRFLRYVRIAEPKPGVDRDEGLRTDEGALQTGTY
jgi:hypothetical protein